MLLATEPVPQPVFKQIPTGWLIGSAELTESDDLKKLRNLIGLGQIHEMLYARRIRHVSFWDEEEVTDQRNAIY